MKKFVSDLLAHDLRAKGPSPARLKEDGLRFETKVLTLKARGGVDVPTVLSQFISTLLTVNRLPHVVVNGSGGRWREEAGRCNVSPWSSRMYSLLSSDSLFLSWF